jgi:pyruvate/2-oxoglutarate/acetoin dehydrogenase E1 component
MSYKQSISDAMTALAADPLVRFVGYGMRKGGAMGTLKGVRPEQIVEMPVAENLMTGAAIGMALTGLRPVVYFERADFLLCGADAIVNHLDKLAMISRGEFRPGVIIRVTIGNRNKPLFTGPTHTQNFARAFRMMLQATTVRELIEGDDPRQFYQDAYEALTRGQSTMVFEHKDLM